MVLETIADAEVEVAVVLELAEEGVVVFADEEVAVGRDHPMVGNLVGGGGAEVGVVVARRIKGKEAEDQVLVH